MMHLNFALVAQSEEQIPSKNEVGSSILSRGANFYFLSPGGGIGRRSGLKIRRDSSCCRFESGSGH